MRQTIACGIHAVRLLLVRSPGRVKRVHLAAGRSAGRLAELQQLAQKAGIAVLEADAATLDRLAEGQRHQGAVAEVLPRSGDPETQLEEALAAAEGPPLLLVLDGLQDPHNLGACLRSADAAGVHAVLAPRDRAVGLTPVVRKVAAGAADAVPFIAVVNLARTLRDLRSRGLWLVGLDADGERTIYGTDLRGPLALVMGAEGQGLRRLTRENCDQLVSIPMAGSVESLNVSVATGVVLFEAVRQRRGEGIGDSQEGPHPALSRAARERVPAGRVRVSGSFLHYPLSASHYPLVLSPIR
jgi:23S rRNA (guanosine2251-2'-O)-methyltransferase